ncbi:putative AAA family ATPase/60S ribosome export protein Rix7 [Xylariaceae sp. FL0255]|nr:putative AAA family ATPase/60S ribosome export protein Rix7 [Xylariaceae sp. FL0255]
MPPRAQSGLDRDVYQIIRKLEDQDDGKPQKLTVTSVYDSIKRSNSSLARQKKRPLEDAIDRVLRIRQEETQEDDEEAQLDDEPAPASPRSKERDYYLLNKQIAKSWNIPKTPQSQPEDTAVPELVTNIERQSNGEPKLKRRKAERKEDRSPPTDASLADLGGMDDAIEVLVKSVTWPMHSPEACEKGLVKPARGILIHGPPGCGKSMLAKAYAASLGVAFIPVSAPSLVAGMSGESEKKIRELYDEAKKLAPCLIFIDEIDAIMGKRENAQREMEKRIVAQMLTCMDDCDPRKMGGKLVVTLAATNRPDSIDPALRRAGRFNHEIGLGIPNEPAREAILRKMLSQIPIGDDVDYKILAKRTPGFVGADLEDLISMAQTNLAQSLMSQIAQEASSTTMEVDSEIPPPSSSSIVKLHYAILAAPKNAIPMEQYTLHMPHFLEAIKQVQPSSKREGFSTIPDTTWSHIGALENVREELMLSIVKPIQQPESFALLGINSPSGVLLWGPPGCGKTLLAKAVANESKANFISVKGPELLNKYVGESERSIRQVFSRARTSAPCIVFFDELDALVPRRDSSGTDSSARVVNQLLTELDGMNSRSGVYVIGATNRPDMIDPAILRPGRLGTNIFVDLPDANGRVEILKTRIRRLVPGYTDLVLLEDVARDPRCEGFSGADIDNLHIAAAKSAIRRIDLQLGAPSTLLREDWERALCETKPSVSNSHSQKFRQLKELGWE